MGLREGISRSPPLMAASAVIMGLTFVVCYRLGGWVGDWHNEVIDPLTSITVDEKLDRILRLLENEKRATGPSALETAATVVGGGGGGVALIGPLASGEPQKVEALTTERVPHVDRRLRQSHDVQTISTHE